MLTTDEPHLLPPDEIGELPKDPLMAAPPAEAKTPTSPPPTTHPPNA